MCIEIYFKIQQYQMDAVDSVVGIFKGQPYSDPVNYRGYRVYGGGSGSGK